MDEEQQKKVNEELTEVGFGIGEKQVVVEKVDRGFKYVEEFVKESKNKNIVKRIGKYISDYKEKSLNKAIILIELVDLCKRKGKDGEKLVESFNLFEERDGRELDFDKLRGYVERANNGLNMSFDSYFNFEMEEWNSDICEFIDFFSQYISSDSFDDVDERVSVI